jgi:hypothetical protein
MAKVVSQVGNRPRHRAGTAAVIASMTRALTNLPVVYKRLSRPVLLKVAFSTTVQVAIGIAVLAIQRLVIPR